jgi:Clathrin adaptor complex small chain
MLLGNVVVDDLSWELPHTFADSFQTRLSLLPKPRVASELRPTTNLQPCISSVVCKANMINAVLVFNNAGQPRLTKFYTQLVPLHRQPIKRNLTESRKRPYSSV